MMAGYSRFCSVSIIFGSGGQHLIRNKIQGHENTFHPFGPVATEIQLLSKSQ